MKLAAAQDPLLDSLWPSFWRSSGTRRPVRGEGAEPLKARCHTVGPVTVPGEIIRRFVKRYQQ